MRAVLFATVVLALAISGCVSDNDDDAKADSLAECLDTLGPIATGDDARRELELKCEVLVERLFDEFNPDRAAVEVRLAVDEQCDTLIEVGLAEEAGCNR